MQNSISDNTEEDESQEKKFYQKCQKISSLFNIYRHVIGTNNVIGVNRYYFASVLFDFALRERLVNKTDAKIQVYYLFTPITLFLPITCL